MNQLMQVVDLEKVNLLNQMDSPFDKHCPKLPDGSYEFVSFAAYCHSYADHLFNYSSFNKYEAFIEQFNRIIEGDKTYRLHKEIQDANSTIPYIFTNYSLAKIQDKRLSINSSEFSREKDLEDELYDSFVSWFGDEVTVERQQVLGYGQSDLSINGSIAIELKKGKAKRKDVYQTFEYSFDDGVKILCLIAAGFDETVLDIANRLNVSCYQYCFAYEDKKMNGYPCGFVLEKVSNSETNDFDDLLEEMDYLHNFSNYDPTFNFNDRYQEEFSRINAIGEHTRMCHEKDKERILEYARLEGLDTSKGLRDVLRQIEEREAKE